MSKKDLSIVQIENRIYEVRGKRVVLDEDLARLYQVTTAAFNQAIKRNLERFPEDFMFQLTNEEYSILRSQIVIVSGKAGRRALPRAFTEHGVIMAASILNSQTATDASILIVRTFMRMREMLAEHSDLKRRLDNLERRLAKKFVENEEELQEIRFMIHQLQEPISKRKRPIGFRESKEKGKKK